ncbi:hypothetical protein G5B00_09100 [Parapedobacter sp. SGR-10]|nr:hypothetical protein [Parapedobacter sp. SGR-10]NGF56671.1 hypothetical protein [Parapedobacter sp. SGR-10]
MSRYTAVMYRDVVMMSGDYVAMSRACTPMSREDGAIWHLQSPVTM